VSSSSPEFLSELLGASVCMQLHFKNRWKSFYDMSYNNVSKQVRLNWVQYTFEIFTTTLLKFLHEFLPSWYSASLLCTHEHWHTWSSHMRNLIFFRVWAMPMTPDCSAVVLILQKELWHKLSVFKCLANQLWNDVDKRGIISSLLRNTNWVCNISE